MRTNKHKKSRTRLPMKRIFILLIMAACSVHYSQEWSHLRAGNQTGEAQPNQLQTKRLLIKDFFKRSQSSYPYKIAVDFLHLRPVVRQHQRGNPSHKQATKFSLGKEIYDILTKEIIPSAVKIIESALKVREPPFLIDDGSDTYTSLNHISFPLQAHLLIVFRSDFDSTSNLDAAAGAVISARNNYGRPVIGTIFLNLK